MNPLLCFATRRRMLYVNRFNGMRLRIRFRIPGDGPGNPTRHCALDVPIIEENKADMAVVRALMEVFNWDGKDPWWFITAPLAEKYQVRTLRRTTASIEKYGTPSSRDSVMKNAFKDEHVKLTQEQARAFCGEAFSGGLAKIPPSVRIVAVFLDESSIDTEHRRSDSAGFRR